MMTLLVLRERIKKFYKENDAYILPVIKFLFALIIFQTINSEIGYDARLRSVFVVLILSALSAFSPTVIMVLLAAITVILHVYSASPILSIIIIVIMLILYLLLARYTPNLGYVVLALPILYVLKVPYIVPLLLGLIATPIAIIPMECGIILYFVIRIIKDAANMQIDKSVGVILQSYMYVIDKLIGNQTLVITGIIFALIVLVTYTVRRLKIDYAFEISIAAGTLVSILGILISYIILDNTYKILGMIIGTIVSTAAAYAFHFFVMTLDYSAVEYVQFEDDSYYYYVKAIPKVTVTTPKKDVKHINSMDTSKLGGQLLDRDEDEMENEDSQNQEDSLLDGEDEFSLHKEDDLLIKDDLLAEDDLFVKDDLLTKDDLDKEYIFGDVFKDKK